MAAISTSLLGPLNQFSFLYTAALLVLPLNISALRKITNINFLIIFLLAACSASIILADPAAKNEPPLIVVCDEISDPHNLGAIIRTAYCAGAHGVVIPKRRSAGLTSVVAKTSAGAVSHMKVARVPNIPSLLKDLKKQGVWVFGTAANGTTGLYDADLKGAAAIVIGSEGDGMTRLAAENCDFLVSIPMKGDLNSLNASASAAILLYEAVRQRMN